MLTWSWPLKDEFPTIWATLQASIAVVQITNEIDVIVDPLALAITLEHNGDTWLPSSNNMWMQSSLPSDF